MHLSPLSIALAAVRSKAVILIFGVVYSLFAVAHIVSKVFVVGHCGVVLGE